MDLTELAYIKKYIHVDYDDDDDLIEEFAEAAKDYVSEGFSTYDATNPVHKILMLKAVKELYDHREDLDGKIITGMRIQQMLAGETK